MGRIGRIGMSIAVAMSTLAAGAGTAHGDAPAHTWQHLGIDKCLELDGPIADVAETTGNPVPDGTSEVVLTSSTTTVTVTLNVSQSAQSASFSTLPSTVIGFVVNGEKIVGIGGSYFSPTILVSSVKVCLQGLPAPTDPQLAMVVGEDSPLVDGDVPIHTLAEQIGDVTLVDDNDLATTDLSGYDAVLLASSVNITTVGTQLKSLNVPVVSWEGMLHKANGLANDGGETASKYKTIRITAAAHPIAAGLSGLPTVTSKTSKLSYARVPSSADVIAAVPNRAGQATVFTYDTGDQLADGSAAASCRVGLFPDYFGGRWLTADGGAIVTAAIEWAIDCPDPS